MMQEERSVKTNKDGKRKVKFQKVSDWKGEHAKELEIETLEELLALDEFPAHTKKWKHGLIISQDVESGTLTVSLYDDYFE